MSDEFITAIQIRGANADSIIHSKRLPEYIRKSVTVSSQLCPNYKGFTNQKCLLYHRIQFYHHPIYKKAITSGCDGYIESLVCEVDRSQTKTYM